MNALFKSSIDNSFFFFFTVYYIFSKLKALKYSQRIIHIYKDKNLILTELNVYRNQSLIINVATMDLVFDIASICGERLVKGVACSSNAKHNRAK